AAGELGISPSAFDLAREINMRCEYGFEAEAMIGIATLVEATGLTLNETILAATELDDTGYIKYVREMGGPGAVLPQNRLFLATDRLIHDFNPSDDVKTLTATMLNSKADQF